MLGKVSLIFVAMDAKSENSTASFGEGGGFNLHISEILSWHVWGGILALMFF